jgi:riboflavin kinase/FMN adenylyltransferase
MKGGVFALGNFDGVHCGHRRVLDAAVAKGRAVALPARVLTFEPHPRAYFQQNQPSFRLTPPAAKERLLIACGVSDVITLPFNGELAQLSARDFVEQILVARFGAQHIVAGQDFAFGHKRGGDMTKLAEWLAPHNITVTEIAPLNDVEGCVYSSSRIRAFLQQGDVMAAAQILGRDWSLAGTIINGAQRGRTIGIPTANIALDDYLRPAFGVYAVTANRVGQGPSYRGVANIGVRPTVDGSSDNLEAHLFDFDQNIYGQEWEFALTRYIRPERKFDSLTALQTQIALDIVAAKMSVSK